MRIAVGGIGHETNTFPTLMTGMEDFHIRRGDELVQGEFWDGYRKQGVEWSPAFVASAPPHGLVRRNVYLELKHELLERLGEALPVDGIYLSLHGAMEVEDVGDGESDLVGSIRQLVGPEVLLSASFDLHGNIAPALVEDMNILTALRTAPHRDGGPTRQRAVEHLVRCCREGIHSVAALVKPPLLLPGEFAVTEVEPARSLYQRLEQIESIPGVLDASLFIGCAWTDSPYTSTSVIVVAEQDHELAYHHAAQLAREVWEQREAFRVDVETATIDEAITHALAASESTVFISDSGDNVTAGGAGDIPLIAERLLAMGATDAVVAGIADPQAVERCAQAGQGARIELSIGGRLDSVNGSPLAVTGSVVYLSAEENPELAVVQVDGVQIVLATDRRAFASLRSFEQAGIDALSHKIVVVKLGYLFPELRDNAPRAIMALSPGFTDLQLGRLPFKRIQRPIYPLDKDFVWEPNQAR